RAILRRRELDRAEAGNGRRTVGALEFDLAGHVVRVEGRAVALTPSEFRVLTLLSERPGQGFSRRRLMQHLCDSTAVADPRAADAHVANLRRKIEEDPAEPARLVTVRGAGYMLVEV